VYAGPDLVETTSYETIEDILDERGLLYTQEPNVERKVAELLHEGRTVAWCQGKMEYGPRALGNRSILANPTNNQNKDRVNNRVKFREAWRPFAPSILEEAADKYLIDPLDDPFMISSASVKEDKLDQIPAVVHVDGTSRPQIVKKDVNPRYWKLINEFENLSGVPVLLNTSYNLSGDPIVLSARDAIKTFYDSGLSFLALDDYILYKKNVDSVKKILFE
jgi:carbamoyltransferase